MTTLEPRSTPGMSYLAEGDIEWETQTPASRRKILRLDDDLYDSDRPVGCGVRAARTRRARGRGDRLRARGHVHRPVPQFQAGYRHPRCSGQFPSPRHPGRRHLHGRALASPRRACAHSRSLVAASHSEPGSPDAARFGRRGLQMTARGEYRPARALSGRDRGGIRYLIRRHRHDVPARSTPSRRHRVCCPFSPAPGTLSPAARSLATPPSGSHSHLCTRLGSTIFEPRFASLSPAKTGQVARPRHGP